MTFKLVEGCVLSSGDEAPEEWEPVLSQLCHIYNNLYWWIGDMVVMGEARFGDDIFQYMPEGITPETIDRCANMAKHYPRSDRHHNLSWAHHAAAAGLDRGIEQALLNKASEECWSAVQLREHVEEKWNRRRTLSS